MKNHGKQTKLLEEEINHLESVTNNQDLPELIENYRMLKINYKKFVRNILKVYLFVVKLNGLRMVKNLQNIF